jgi:transcriptional regulator with XRE-family HTH domain
VREIPWHWFRPGPERDAARARDRRRRERRADSAGVRARALARAERDSEMRRLRGEGWTGRAIAERFGVAESTVSKACSGMPSRRRYGDPRDLAWPCPRRRPPSPQCRAPVGSDFPAGPADELGPRDTRRTGSCNGRAKLDEAGVARLRRLREEGRSYRELAREFGISRSNVWYVLSGSTWSHVRGGLSASGE